MAVLLCACRLFAADALAPNQPIMRELPAGGTQEFAISPQSPGYFEVELQPDGLRLALTGPVGIQLELSGAAMRPVRVCWMEDEPRPVTLSVRSLEAHAVRKYSLEWTTRAAQPVDAERVRGCALQAQAFAIRDLAAKADTLEAALKAFQSAGDWRGQAEVLTALGEALSDAGKDAEAVNAHERAVAAWRRAGDTSREAAAMTPLGMSYALQSGKATLAASTLRDAVALAQKSGDRLAEAAARNALAGQIAQSGDGQWEAMVRQAIALFGEQGDRWGEGGAWNNLGYLKLNAGSLEDAESAFNRSLDFRRELQDEAGVAQCLNNLSVVYAQRGEPAKAVAALGQALEIRKRIAAPKAIANTEHNLGVSYVQQGDVDRGIALFEQALALWRSTGYRFGEGLTLAELATAYDRLGEQDRAERIYRDALAIDRSLQNRRSEADVLHNLGGILRNRRLYTQAAELEQQALQICRQGGFRTIEERVLVDLGSIQSGMGRHDEALAELNAAVKIARAGPRQDLSGAQSALGIALLHAGQAAAALAAYRDALQTAEELGSTGDQATGAAGMARAFLALGDAASARSEALTAMGLLEDLRARIPSAGSRADFFSRRHDVFQSAVEAMMRTGEVAAAFDASERGRARSLSDLLASLKETPATGQETRREEQNLRVAIAAKSDHLTRLLIRGATAAETDPVRGEISRLLDRYRELEEGIARANPQMAQTVRPAALQEVQQRLGPGEALLEFALGEEHSYAWLVDRESVEGVELPRRSEIESSAAEFRARVTAHLAGQSAETAGASARLSSQLFPAGSRISRAAFLRFKKLYVVPDGELHSVPFAALGPLEPLDLDILPSASVLTHLPQTKHSPRTVAVFADPVYESSDDRLAKGSAAAFQLVTRGPEDEVRFPRLRFSDQEASAIVHLAGPGRSVKMTGFAVSRRALLAKPLEGYDILHFATHAVIYPTQPELSAIVLSLFDERGRPVDGFLHMYDVAGMRLNSQLVVLSACDTALGRKLEGEGPLGIARTFLSAGASGVVATLWAVDDAATAQFMAAFYRGLLKQGLSPAAALRSAQRSVRSRPRWSEPYYWAGFIYTGR